MNADDESLMQAYCSGSESAFTELYGRYEKKLYAFLHRRISSRKRSLVDDLFQKTWLKIHQARGQFDTQQKFSTWAYTIALNTLRDQMGLASERFEVESSDDDSAALSAPNFEDRIFAKADLKLLEKMLLELPVGQREALMLTEIEGLSNKDAGSVLNVSEGGIRQLLFRARKNLKLLIPNKAGQND